MSTIALVITTIVCAAPMLLAIRPWRRRQEALVHMKSKYDASHHELRYAQERYDSADARFDRWLYATSGASLLLATMVLLWHTRGLWA